MSQVLAALVTVGFLYGAYRLLLLTGASPRNARTAAFVGLPFLLFVAFFIGGLIFL